MEKIKTTRAIIDHTSLTALDIHKTRDRAQTPHTLAVNHFDGSDENNPLSLYFKGVKKKEKRIKKKISFRPVVQAGFESR